MGHPGVDNAFLIDTGRTSQGGKSLGAHLV